MFKAFSCSDDPYVGVPTFVKRIKLQFIVQDEEGVREEGGCVGEGV